MTTKAFTSLILQEIPDTISPDDHSRLMDTDYLDIESRVLLYQEMIDRYTDSPYLLVRLAELYVLVKQDPLALNLYRKAQDILSTAGVVDNVLNARIENHAFRVDAEINDIVRKSQQAVYYQKSKLAKDHRFPTNQPHIPAGAQDLKEQWQRLSSEGSDAYLNTTAIETNHVESIFFLTQSSTQDLVRRGVSEGVVDYLPQSSLQDPVKIKKILSETLAAYALSSALCDNLDSLNKDTICRIHACLMKTCQFSHSHFILAGGKTRTETRKTVVVAGAYVIQCCPFSEVDTEIDYICKMSRQWIKSWRNPFATASWIHLILVRCHPFDDGNGRLVRLISSIPLLRHGYPPISISLSQRADYYDAINKAFEGDHEPFIQCLLKGMQETIASVQSLFES